MLLESKLIHVPALAEREADLNEYGCLGLKVRAAFGEAACEAGNPDHGLSDTKDSAVDAIANVLHYANEAGIDAQTVLGTALRHFQAELEA